MRPFPTALTAAMAACACVAAVAAGARAQTSGGALTARLGEIGAKILPSGDELDVLRFLDDNGITVEVRTVK